jgi:hypothetical protein
VIAQQHEDRLKIQSLELERRSAMTSPTLSGDAVINRLTAILGLLQISPWLFGFATVEVAAWTAGIGGIAVTVMSFAAFIDLREWKEWVCLMTGLFLVVSPRLLGFVGIASATWTHIVIGLLVTALATIEHWRLHGAPPTRIHGQHL